MTGRIFDELTDPWPTWANRWWGIALRAAVCVGGVLLGGLMVFLGYFAATFKKYPAEWTLENVSLVAGGIVMALAAIAVAVRPSKLTFGLVVGLIMGVVFLGSAL